MDMEHFNGLTPAEAERLAILAEECAEVIQVVGKILRHGYTSRHPVIHEDNIYMLERECGDVRAAMLMMCKAGDINKANIHLAADEKLERVKKYCHHQN